MEKNMIGSSKRFFAYKDYKDKNKVLQKIKHIGRRRWKVSKDDAWKRMSQSLITRHRQTDRQTGDLQVQ